MNITNLTKAAQQSIWIDNDADLLNYCNLILETPVIAMDTEFIRTNSYYPKPALIQIATHINTFLIDPLTIKVWTPLEKIMTSPNITKILHSFREDLETFNMLMDIPYHNIVDTQRAAAYVGLGYSESYVSLVHKITGHTLNKGEQRSAWMRRPLNNEQLNYAVQDVIYILPVYQHLLHKLKETQYLDWFFEDCQTIISSSKNKNKTWKEIKKAWLLTPKQLTTLRELWYFREEQAQTQDIPRNHVIHNDSLWELAKQQPDTLHQLSFIKKITPATLRKYGDKILHTIEQSNKQNLLDSNPIAFPLPKHMRDYKEIAKQFIQTLSQQLNLPRELLLTNKLLQEILRSFTKYNLFTMPPSLQGWRREIVAKPLIEDLNKHLNDYIMKNITTK